MLQGFVGCHAAVWVGGQAVFDELARGLRDVAPVFEGREGVVCDEDGLHLFKVRVAVEGGVAAQEEVGYDANGPDITEQRNEVSFVKV